MPQVIAAMIFSSHNSTFSMLKKISDKRPPLVDTYSQTKIDS